MGALHGSLWAAGNKAIGAAWDRRVLSRFRPWHSGAPVLRGREGVDGVRGKAAFRLPVGCWPHGGHSARGHEPRLVADALSEALMAVKCGLGLAVSPVHARRWEVGLLAGVLVKDLIPRNPEVSGI